jgi:CMP-N-acetylneuraminic acid synthetase
MRKDIICLICCRGGSKGIPGKNIKEFCGKPLLGWTLSHAKESQVFDNIILSTDSKEIAAIGKEYGAVIPGFRPKLLASDDSNVFDVHRYVFDLLNISDKTHVVCILTNNPFIDSALIKEGYKIAKTKQFEIIALDSVRVGGDYLAFRQLYEENGILKHYYPDKMLASDINRQTYRPTFTTINNMRWGKPSYMTDYDVYKNEIIENGVLSINLPKIRNFDIDDPDDWRIAEAVFNGVFL